MISKSFAITGRVIDNGVRRLKQNVRHLLNIFMPRGVEPSADGWKLSLRNRMVHARVRSLFRTPKSGTRMHGGFRYAVRTWRCLRRFLCAND